MKCWYNPVSKSHNWYLYISYENEFNLYCGSGYDEDYINSVIAINSYRPDSGDFTNIFC